MIGRRALLLSAVVALSAWGRPAGAQQYTYTQIDYPGATQTFVTGINDQGTIAGFYMVGTTASGFTRSSTGVFTPYSAEGQSTAFSAVNNNGVLLGIEYSSPRQMFYYNGTLNKFQLSIPFVSAAEPRGINSSNLISGTVWSNFPTIAGFLYNPSTQTTTQFVVPPTAPGSGGSTSLITFAKGINTAGQVVGYYGSTNGPTGFIRNLDGTFQYFTVPNGTFGTGSTDDLFRSEGPNGINDGGAIVGAVGVTSGPNPSSFIRNPNGTSLIFNPPGALQSVATGINNSGVVVGHFADRSTDHGYIATPTP